MGVGHIVFQTCHFGYLGQYIETEVVVEGEKGGHFLHQGMRLSLLLHVFQVSRILLCFSGWSCRKDWFHFFAGISPEKLFLLSCKLPLPFSAKVVELGTSYGESWYRIQCILVQVAVELDTQYIRIYRHTLPYVQPDTYIRVDSYVSNVTGHMLLMLPDMLLWSFTSKEPVVFFKCPYVFDECQYLYLKGQHVLMKRPACFMNQLSWSDGQAYHVRQTSQVGSLHYPLTMQVFTFLLSFCHFI